MADRLLDTNAVSAAMRAVAALDAHLAGLEEDTALYLSVVVEGEVRWGIARLASGRKRRNLSLRLEHVLANVQGVLTLGRETAQVYSDLKADLWSRGRPMADNDMWIAASALEHGLIVVTNDALFQNVRGIKVEDWRET